MRISIAKVFFACLVLVGTAYGITILRAPRVASEKRRAIEQLEKQNEALHREIEEKQNYLKRLQQNPDDLELEIKRRLMLVTPGSKSFILQEETKPSAQQAPESSTTH